MGSPRTLPSMKAGRKPVSTRLRGDTQKLIQAAARVWELKNNPHRPLSDWEQVHQHRRERNAQQ